VDGPPDWLRWVFDAVILLAGWLVKRQLESIKDSETAQNVSIAKIQGDMSDLRADLPKTYALKEDIDKRLDRIEQKLDRVIEKAS